MGHDFIGGSGLDVIIKDLEKLRVEVKEECEKIATQFQDHRNYLHDHFKPQLAAHQVGGKKGKSKIRNPGTIAFLNRKRYHLYRIASEWNSVLDGLHSCYFEPKNESQTESDNANRWMKKFKAPFKTLRSGTSRKGTNLVQGDNAKHHEKERDRDRASGGYGVVEDGNSQSLRRSTSHDHESRDNGADVDEPVDDELLNAALQEVDEQIAIANAAHQASKAQTSDLGSPSTSSSDIAAEDIANIDDVDVDGSAAAPGSSAAASTTGTTTNTPVSASDMPKGSPSHPHENGNGDLNTLSIPKPLQKRSSSESDQPMMSTITPRTRNVQFMVDFNSMFDDESAVHKHPPQHSPSRKSPEISLKMPSTINMTPTMELIASDEEKGVDCNSPILALPVAAEALRGDMSPSKSQPLPPSATELRSEITDTPYLASSPALAPQSQAAQQRISPSGTASTEDLRSPSIPTALFPNTSTSNVQIPSSMKHPKLSEVDLDRLKEESLFLVSACTEDSGDVGADPNYAHLNLPKCMNNTVIPIYVDEPSAIIAYTLSSLEYHCQMANIPTKDVRSCRQRAVPSVAELENRVMERQRQRRSALDTELQIRAKSNRGKLYKAENGDFEATTGKNDGSNKGSAAEWSGSPSVEEELDLEDLLVCLLRACFFGFDFFEFESKYFVFSVIVIM